MRHLLIAILLSLGLIGIAQAQTTGLCDTTPETYVSTNGMVQVRYNVKPVTITDMDGKTSHTAYSYEYKNISKLDQGEIEKQLSTATVSDLKDKPLKVGIEKVVGYSGPDKAAYEAKFNTDVGAK